MRFVSPWSREVALWANTGAQVLLAIADPGTLACSSAEHTVHGVQLSALSPVLNPSTQAPQLRFTVVLPGALTNCPGAHVTQGTHAVPELASSSQVPVAHGSFGADSPAQNVPAGQGSQTAADVRVAGAVWTVLAGHAPFFVHAAWFGTELYVPSGQGAHRRSAMVLPGARTYAPGWHSVKALQLSAFASAV